MLYGELFTEQCSPVLICRGLCQKTHNYYQGQLYRLLCGYLTSGDRYAETDCASTLAMQRLTLDMTGVVARHKRGVQNSTRQVKVDFHARHFGAKRCAMVCLALI
jgi:hypothetical protein